MGTAELIQHIGGREHAVPSNLFCKPRFVSQSYNLHNDVAMPVQFKVFRANGPYDPDPAFLTDGAAFWAELGISYQSYICWGSRIKVYCSDNSGSDVPSIVGVFPTTTTGPLSNEAPTTFAGLQSFPNAKWGYVQEFTGNAMSFVTNELKIRDFYGRDVRGDGQFQGTATGNAKSLTTGSNPARLFGWVIGVYDATGLHDANVFITAEIEYFVEFEVPVIPSSYTVKKPETVDITPLFDSAKEQEKSEDPDMSDSVMVDKLKAILKKV